MWSLLLGTCLAARGPTPNASSQPGFTPGSYVVPKYEKYADNYCKNGGKQALWAYYTEEYYQQLTFTIAERLGLKDGEKIFDSGMGCGAFFHYLQKKYARARLCGIDATEHALEYAREQYPGSNFQQADARDLRGFSNFSMDHAVTLGLLNAIGSQHLSPAKKLSRSSAQYQRTYEGAVQDMCCSVREMYRLLRPKGSMYLYGMMDEDCRNHPNSWEEKDGFYISQQQIADNCMKGLNATIERFADNDPHYCPSSFSLLVSKPGLSAAPPFTTSASVSTTTTTIIRMVKKADPASTTGTSTTTTTSGSTFQNQDLSLQGLLGWLESKLRLKFGALASSSTTDPTTHKATSMTASTHAPHAHQEPQDTKSQQPMQPSTLATREPPTPPEPGAPENQ